MAKSNGIIIVPIVFTVLIYLWHSKKINKNSFLKSSVIFSTVSFITGIWYIGFKIISKFDPDNITLRSLYRLATAASRADVPSRPLEESVSKITDWNFLHDQLYQYSFTKIGWYPIDAPEPSLILIEILTVVSLVGLGFFFILLKKKNSLYGFRPTKSHLVIMTSSIIFMISAILVKGFIGNALARNAFPVISIFGIFFVLGWYVIFNRTKFKFLVITPLIILGVLNIQLILIIIEKMVNVF